MAPSDWSDSVLNVYEKQNVQLIQKYESLGGKVPFITSSVAGGTQLTGDGFTITLPSVWNSSNYFINKTEFEDYDCYEFHSKNNFVYGYNGVVFTLYVFARPITQDEQMFANGMEELGNDGINYVFIGEPTDIQSAFDIPALETEWNQLHDTYSQIVSSFEM